ncbi:MAG: histidine--tRNA ligase [Planctomycetes bacterium]|nr:histidine--tRNA ligase [Planctomycetota bacterium]
MKIQAVKGTRDFYPQEMRLRNWIMDAWRRVSIRNGFEEYDGPIFEYLDLFAAKSGPEIASQLFNFTDRGGRNLAIRPEITPTLARMVNAKINSLPRPIKWFSMPRLCRAENPQKGRLREFFQWNIDVIGENSVLADAECIYVCVDAMRELGLTKDDVQIRIGSRAVTTEFLKLIGVPDEKLDSILPVLDKRAKVPDEAFVEMAKNAGLDDKQIKHICEFQDLPAADAVKEYMIQHALVTGGGVVPGVGELQQLEEILAVFGIRDYWAIDFKVVRGLAYYTGIVYEVFDKGQSMRALAGGGRYDNLLEVLGGPKVGACGFGMGDVVLGIMLEEKGKIPKDLIEQRLDFFVINPDSARPKDGQDSNQVANNAIAGGRRVIEMVTQLRSRGVATDFDYSCFGMPLGKQLKEANRRGAAKAVIIQPDGQTVSIKDLSTGSQKDGVPIKDFLENPGRAS